MKRLLLCLAIIACDSTAPEPAFPPGTFTILSINGVQDNQPIDTVHANCPMWVDKYLSSMNLGSMPDASIHLLGHVECFTLNLPFDDAVQYHVNGSAISLQLSKASVAFTGTVSADQDTLTINDFRDVWHLDRGTTARIVWVRTH